MSFSYFLVAVGAVVIVVFALQNAEQVTIRFLVWKLERVPLAALVLISVVMGGLLMSLVGFVQHWKLRARIRQLEVRQRSAGPENP